ncbi:MAG: pentapeptide repeat-containing protein [Spirulina sp. SIO3F2]|nr:pentapeptide repeat-containing protein [Spirulina sp. SIO3F2]
MANPEHVAILEQGVEAWNEWRSKSRLIKPNLSKFDLIGADLSRANLRETDLNGADLIGANLVEANLSETNLVGAGLSGANLSRANLVGANLNGANLIGAKLREADLSGAKLRKANLIRANLSGAELRKADFSRAELTKANLVRANLNEANLIRADLNEAELGGVNFKEADLSGANLSRVDLGRVDLGGANLSRVDLRETRLIGANLDGVNLSGSDLSGIDLRKINFIGANLSGAKLIQTQVLNSDFQGANFTDACILDWHINSDTNLANVCCNAIYLGWDDDKNEPSDRRPRDPNKTFAPGDFTRLMEQSQETVDLIFSQGIDWSAFLTSFQNLQVSGEHSELSIQGINKKSDGSFVISVDTPLGTNKAAVERDFQTQYDAELKRLEAVYQEKLNAKDQEIQIYREQNTNMTDIVKMLASRPINVANVVDHQGNKSINQEFPGTVYGVAGSVEGNQVINRNSDTINMNATSHDQSKQVNIGKVAGGTVNISNPEATDPEIVATVAYIQALIADRTAQRNLTSTAEQLAIVTEVIQEIETKPNWKAKAIQAAKSGALESLKSNPVGAFVVSAIESWIA